jgi:hypothetical protein
MIKNVEQKRIRKQVLSLNSLAETELNHVLLVTQSEYCKLTGSKQTTRKVKKLWSLYLVSLRWLKPLTIPD